MATKTGRPECAHSVRYRFTQIVPRRFSSFSCPRSNSQDRISKVMGRFPRQIVAAVQNAMLVTSSEHRGVVRSTTGLERILRAIQSDGGRASRDARAGSPAAVPKQKR